MRFFCFITALVLSLSIIHHTPVKAQETQTTNPVAESAQSAPDESTLDKGSIYAQATDRQIKEAQRFYKYCTQHDYLKEEKDCKCAATTFLETRIELGEQASASEIVKHNENTCFRKKELSNIGEKDIDMSHITDAQLAEAQNFFNKCKKDKSLSRNYDCKCISAHFLEKRLELGPTASEDLVFLKIQGQCPNVVETTGYTYSSCMTKAPPQGLGNIEIKSYCECFAREWARAYESLNGQVDVSITVSLKTKAQIRCMDPGQYK